jgi:hypothetical protein
MEIFWLMNLSIIFFTWRKIKLPCSKSEKKLNVIKLNSITYPPSYGQKISNKSSHFMKSLMDMNWYLARIPAIKFDLYKSTPLKKIITYSSLRIIALIVLVVGAVASLILMFNAGRNQKSFLLIVLFTGWVLSPFIALLVADVISKRWLLKTRVTLYFLTLFITFVSLLGYSGALNVPGTKPAFKFLIVPVISWVLILISIPITVSRSRRKSPENNGTN